jgi:hypothetical protein
MTIFYYLGFETPPTWRPRSQYLYPSGTGWRNYTQALGSLFIASYDSQGYGGGIRISLHTGFKVKVKVKVTLRLAVYRRSVHLGVKPLETHDQSLRNIYKSLYDKWVKKKKVKLSL